MSETTFTQHPCVGCKQSDRYYCADNCKKLEKWEQDVDHFMRRK